jgi:ubiquinone/menaquinone biosynthesis C-methylase UbiE
MSAATQTGPGPGGISPEKIMQFAWGFAPTLILSAGIATGVFDVLDKGSLTLAQLASATGCSERGLTSISNALVGMGLLLKNGDAYGATPESSAFLVSTKPSFIGAMLPHLTNQLIPKWLEIDNVVRTGQPSMKVNDAVEGAAFFEQFVGALFAFNYGAANAAADALDIGNATGPVRVLDLAAGSGVWGIALAQRSKQVTVTPVDWPKVLEVTRATAAKFGVADRFTFVGGDLDAADFGKGHNVATLGHILHSEGPERSRSLLKKTLDALAPGGTIVIAEFLVDRERKSNMMGLIFDVNMLVNTTAGQTYSFEEISEWLNDAGFVNARQVPAPGPSPLIFATKP